MVRIILGILFFIVAGRGIVLLSQPGKNGNIYPAVVIVAGVAGCLVMIFWRGRRGRGEG